MNKSSPKYKATPRLKELLAESDFKNQKEFAEAVGVKEPTISRFDRQSRYDIDTLASVSRTLGKTIDELFIIEENNEIVYNAQPKMLIVSESSSDYSIKTKDEK